MRIKHLLFVIFIIALPLLISCELVTTNDNEIEVYALFVGLDYDTTFITPFTSLPSLKGTIPDAKEMAEAIKAKNLKTSASSFLTPKILLVLIRPQRKLSRANI